MRPIFVFSTPPTPNGDLHLGHLSGPYLGADAYVRFQRLNGAAAWHLTGSDDFQSYVVECARREGRSPAETAAHYGAEIAATLKLMDIEPDRYTVTNADPVYRDGLRAFFSALVGSGRVAPREGEALFDATSGDYLYEVDVSGGCPTCGAPCGGNICEECGEPNTCADLVEPVARHGTAPPRAGRARRYSLPLHEFRADVLAHHRAGRVPARLRELADRLFRRPRFDVAVTHPSSWGVPPVEDGAPGQVIWVWPEMAYGFLHGIAVLGRRFGRDWAADKPGPDWKIVHFFGYDNSFYHAVLYPVLYRLAYPQWTPDIDYHVNEFLLLDGEKFSTSRRHAIWGKEILGPHSVDAVRYYLSRIRPEGRRTDFRREEYEAAVRDTLVGTWQQWLHNLGARVEKHHGGTAPEPGTWTPEHAAFHARLGNRFAALTGALGPQGFSLNQAAAELDGIVADAVRFAAAERAVADVEDWRPETDTAVALELAAARLLAYGAAPVMPRFARRLCAALGLPAPLVWTEATVPVPPGTRVDLARTVFFGGAPESSMLPWLREIVRTTLQLPADEPVDDRTLVQLGMASLHTVALQYQLLEQVGVDVPVDDLLGDRDVAALARLVETMADR